MAIPSALISSVMRAESPLPCHCDSFSGFQIYCPIDNSMRKPLDNFCKMVSMSLLNIEAKEKIDMKKIDWMRKLTSRKLWLSVASFVTLMVVACGGTENEAAQISALIMAGATVIGYVIGEGMTDAAAIEAKQADVVR